MALIRWQPFHEMEALQRDMNRMFEALASEQPGSMRQSFMPLAEMEQTEDAIHLKVEVPGMKAEDLDVQVTREAVMITGERKSQSKSQKNGMTRSEFRYGKFNRTIPLPMPIDNNKVQGDYQDGILILELPKLQKEEDKVTKVNIASSSNKSISESQSAIADNQEVNGGYGNQDVWQDSDLSSSQAQSTAS
jgi:HSP20 family protein